MTLNNPEMMRGMLQSAKTIAVVGLSDNRAKASYNVSRHMQELGYRIFPVNPVVSKSRGEVLGEKCYASLAELPETPDIVNVFRLPKYIPAIVDEMISLGRQNGRWKNLWVQLGIVHEEAAARAEAAGIHVVMDRCILVEHQKIALEQNLK